jgi:hypothetical protein
VLEREIKLAAAFAPTCKERLMRKLEKAATITFVVSFLLLAGVLLRSYWLSRRPDPRTIPLVKVGQPVNIPGFSPGDSQSSLVLAISSECPYCIDDLPFYKQLSVARASSGDSLRIVAVLPQNTSTARKFLDDAGVHVDAVLSMSPRRIGVQLFPTLLLLDRTGRLQQFWVGGLTGKQRQEVFSALKKSCTTCSLPTVITEGKS